MNIAYRKLALLEKNFIAREEEARIQGFSSCPFDRDFRNKVTDLLNQVRYL